MKTGKIKCSMQDYHAYPAAGSSDLRTIINQSPAHYWWDKNNSSPSTPAQAFGTLVHQAILEPYDFHKKMIIEPTFSGKGSQAAREEWHLANHGKVVMKQEQHDAISGMIKSVLAHPKAAQLISDGSAEESFFWKDPETGVECKSRPDFLRDGHIIVDVKTTLDAGFTSFKKDVSNYGYYIQAAHYLEGASIVLDKQFDAFVIIAVEKSPPYAVQCFQIDEEAIRVGQNLIQSALKTLKKCQASGIYPAYGEHIQPIDLPPWAKIE